MDTVKLFFLTSQLHPIHTSPLPHGGLAVLRRGINMPINGILLLCRANAHGLSCMPAPFDLINQSRHGVNTLFPPGTSRFMIAS